MKKLSFNIDIKAPKERVWDIMWDDISYSHWTIAFCEGSIAETDWQEGSNVRFMSPGGEGMFSKIRKRVDYEKMWFTHECSIKNNEVQPIDEATKNWTGSEENYFYSAADGITSLKVEIDVVDEYLDFFNTSIPAALAIVKDLAENNIKNKITVMAKVNAPVAKAWDYFTKAEHIMNWNFASDDWHCPAATNDLRVGGKLIATMAARDGSFSFDFESVYTAITLHKRISYEIIDGRTVDLIFHDKEDHCIVVEIFEAEGENSLELQRGGWQAILNNFKKYVDNN